MSRQMGVTPSDFESIIPSRYIAFTLPSLHLRISVLDSPSAGAIPSAASTASMRVPYGRESDWIFSTFSGHLQLLLSSPTPQPLSRLILIANLSPSLISHNNPSSSTPPQNLAPLLCALAPKSASGEIPEVPLLLYEDDVVRSSVVEVCEGPCVGEMLIENVELESDGTREFRRRLRFKRMPNFVQTQVRIHPQKGSNLEYLDQIDFDLDCRVLVQPYLSPMVAGISVISNFLEAQLRDSVKPKALCLGVGGGALIEFLSVQLNFEVVGIEEDEVVLEVGKKYFGLGHEGLVHLISGDGIKYVKDLSKNIRENSMFHIVMIDLDSNDPMHGICAPPIEFVNSSLLLAINGILYSKGVLIINVIPSSNLSYEELITKTSEVFDEVYQIDVGNEENFVVIAIKSKMEGTMDAEECTIFNKLKTVVSTTCIDSITKLSRDC